MNTLSKHISLQTAEFLNKKFSTDSDFSKINQEFYDLCGIIDFFADSDDFIDFKENYKNLADREFKAEFGDYQTNSNLSDKVCKLLIAKDVSPKVVFEPTFGKGNFIISAIKNFKNIEQIYGVEIYKPYIQITKLKILDFFLLNPQLSKPKINLFHAIFLF